MIYSRADGRQNPAVTPLAQWLTLALTRSGLRSADAVMIR
ncbi:hypothetical protein LAH08_04270 [Micromonospora noduli]|uniref:Uncharacterized protein n=1 Tax=Micromonospora noduli TaxID=709876 RepID=A0A328N684_9ACTN|nr:hypothetical protein LAH08_04270 [Micromonospora noduli]